MSTHTIKYRVGHGSVPEISLSDQMLENHSKFDASVASIVSSRLARAIKTQPMNEWMNK